MNNKLMNGSQMVCESLIREGVEHIFGIPGGAILPLYQVLPEFEKLKHILVPIRFLWFQLNIVLQILLRY